MAVKYPLTPEAKEEARALVKYWNEGKIPGLISLTAFQLNPEGDSSIDKTWKPPSEASLRQFDLFNLVQYTVIPRPNDIPRRELLLLQELRNAVDSDFTVSEYFMTMNAVGNIIINSTTGPVQGVGYSEGEVHQTMGALADDLEAHLANLSGVGKGLTDAINELRNAVKGEEKAKIGKVIEQVGFSIGMGADLATLVPVLYTLYLALRMASGMGA